MFPPPKVHQCHPELRAKTKATERGIVVTRSELVITAGLTQKIHACNRHAHQLFILRKALPAGKELRKLTTYGTYGFL